MRKYGLIGYPLSHSFSQPYFTKKFEREGIRDCVYENYAMPSIENFPALLGDNPELCGINVTIPYKQQVIPYLDDISHLPVNACNCISIESGKKIGYNTDTIGFEKSLITLLRPYHAHALVLGTGGASIAVQFVLHRLGIDYLCVGRQKKDLVDKVYGELNAQDIHDHLLIINTTPVGMFPHQDSFPPIPYPFLGPRHYLYDLVYNPAKSIFLQKGEDRAASIKNGADMLVIQAEESWRIWNGLPADSQS